MRNKRILLLLYAIFLINLNCQKNKQFSEYLKPTNYIDCDNLKIIEKAKQLTQGCKTDVEKAKSIKLINKIETILSIN